MKLGREGVWGEGREDGECRMREEREGAWGEGKDRRERGLRGRIMWW